MDSGAVDEERLADLLADNAAFALDLHRHLAAEDGGNTFLSPYGISVALAMAYAGARGETRRQMAETLHYALGEEVHPAFADLRALLAARETTTHPVDDEDVDAFRPGANFDGMVAGDDVDLPIDEVFHETFVSVDQEGTEAAAATATGGAMAPPGGRQWGEIRFDRPFLFCSRDRPTNAVLFLGRVVDAAAAQDG